jgi:hypothetical protein
MEGGWSLGRVRVLAAVPVRGSWSGRVMVRFYDHAAGPVAGRDNVPSWADKKNFFR